MNKKNKENKNVEQQPKIGIIICLLLIILPIIGIPLLWIVKKNISTKKKIIISVISAIWFMLCILSQESTTEVYENNLYSIEEVEEEIIEEEIIQENILDFLNIRISDVRNDVTGNWKICLIADSVNIENYALDYYNTYFENENEIHAIVNFTYGTTSKIMKLGNILNVAIYEYVDKEEHDAKILFSGMLLKEYYINADTGEFI